MLTRPAGHEAEATMYEADTLDNNSVCMSMKTKIVVFSVSNQDTTEMIVDGYIVNIN